ncbi:MAG: hypothetical protein RR091_04770 [Cloacibacillus sp.]
MNPNDTIVYALNQRAHRHALDAGQKQRHLRQTFAHNIKTGGIAIMNINNIGVGREESRIDKFYTFDETGLRTH